MQQQKNNFLDKNSLFAILFLGLCWLVWDAHMKKKYPQSPRKNHPQEQVKTPAIKAHEIKVPSSSRRFYKYFGKQLDLVFSSDGFGVSELKLKNYKDRKGDPIVFKSQQTPFFATQALETKQNLPFSIKKISPSVFVGVFQTKDLTLKKTIEINEKDMLLKTKIEFLKGSKSLEGLQTVFSKKLEEQPQQNFLIKMLTMYGKNQFKGFVFFQGKRNLFFEKDMEDKKTYTSVSIGALGGKYFGKAFVNKSSLSPSMEVEKVDDEILARMTYLFSKEKIKSLEYLSFFGPKSSKTLKPLGEEAKSWIDFGFFSWLSHPLLTLLNLFYKVSSNWGIAIIFLTFFIRLCLLPINIKSYESMKKMQEIQPKIKDLKAQYKDDPKKLNLEVMALMKENKANPLQGCFPLFFQMPIFFALYRVLGESIELYQAPFLLWVNDLSLKDPLYVLPVLAGATLFVQQKLTPMNMPAAQARLLVFMPVLFSVFMLGLPSGLTLYIFVSGLFGLVQQAFFLKFKSHT